MSWLLLFTLACAKDPAPTEPPAGEVTSAEEPADEGGQEVDDGAGSARPRDGQASPTTGDGGSQPAKGPPKFGGNIDVTADPVAAYNMYRDRLEGPEAEGECSADADCARAGCSSEVCVPADRAAEINTTCEVLPVFTVLDTCGCIESRCSWTVKQ